VALLSLSLSLSLGTRAPGALSSHFALFLGSRLRD